VFAVIVATGVDTKLSLNQRQPPSKFSTLETRMNRAVIGIFCFKFSWAILSGIIGGVYQVLIFLYSVVTVFREVYLMALGIWNTMITLMLELLEAMTLSPILYC
jgi:hypothetical protein